MKEVVGEYTGKEIGPTHFQGQLPIDGIWAMTDITISNACIMTTGYGIGDHQLFIIDIHTSSLIGMGALRVQRAASRRLNTHLPHVVTKYNKSLEENILRHRLISKLEEAHTQSISVEKIQSSINEIDQQSEQYMKHAEKTCRKLESGRICFSPELVIWIKQDQIYHLLVEYRLGQVKNRGNLKRAVIRQQIQNPFQISMAELKARLEVCEEQNNYFSKYGEQYQKKHLLQRVKAAREEGKEDVVAKILAIIKREQDQAFWRRLNYTCSNVKGGSPTLVQVEGSNDLVNEHVTKADMENAIWTNINCKRFYLAEEAPTCKGRMREDLGYNAVSPTAQVILDGTYEYPEDFDAATRELCKECALIRQIIPADLVGTKMTKEDFMAHWKRATEEISSSHSGLTFSHYMAGILSPYISHFHALKATLFFHHGLVLKHWAQGLLVLLQKVFGCSLITKLCSILLMEADFNGANKVSCGQVVK
jgi:uncharacterized protein (UPF0332 family)